MQFAIKVRFRHGYSMINNCVREWAGQKREDNADIKNQGIKTQTNGFAMRENAMLRNTTGKIKGVSRLQWQRDTIGHRHRK